MHVLNEWVRYEQDNIYLAVIRKWTQLDTIQWRRSVLVEGGGGESTE